MDIATASTGETAGEVSSRFASAFADSLRVYGGKFQLRFYEGSHPHTFLYAIACNFFLFGALGSV
jgi:hypothetical protein